METILDGSISDIDTLNGASTAYQVTQKLTNISYNPVGRLTRIRGNTLIDSLIATATSLTVAVLTVTTTFQGVSAAFFTGITSNIQAQIDAIVVGVPVIDVPIAAIDQNGMVAITGGVSDHLVLEYADATHPGIVSTTSQTFGGSKNISVPSGDCTFEIRAIAAQGSYINFKNSTSGINEFSTGRFGAGVFKIMDQSTNQILTAQTGGNLQLGPIGSTGVVTITPFTQSVSATTGALIVNGGVGVGKDIYTTGNLSMSNFAASNIIALTAPGVNSSQISFQNLTSGDTEFILGRVGAGVFKLLDFSLTPILIAQTGGNVQLGPNTAAGVVTITPTTTSSSSTTGALVVNGGVGIAGACNVGGNITPTGRILLSDGTAASPSLAFLNETGNNSGLYLSGTNNDLAVSISGLEHTRFTSAGIAVTSAATVGNSVIGAFTNPQTAAAGVGLEIDLNGGTVRMATLIAQYEDATNSFLQFGTRTAGTLSQKWRINSGGHYLAETDNTFDIGAIGATRPRTGYFGTSLIAGTAGSTKGLITLAGNTSGTLTIQPSAAAGSWTMTLPPNDGDANQVLQTNGSGVTAWAQLSTANLSNTTAKTDVVLNLTGAVTSTHTFTYEKVGNMVTVMFDDVGFTATATDTLKVQLPTLSPSIFPVHDQYKSNARDESGAIAQAGLVIDSTGLMTFYRTGTYVAVLQNGLAYVIKGNTHTWTCV